MRWSVACVSVASAEIAGLDAPPDWRRADILCRHLAAMFDGAPASSDAPGVRRWLGHRPSTPDGLPCIGPSSATPDVVLAFGHGHVGLAGSARTGLWAARLLAGTRRRQCWRRSVRGGLCGGASAAVDTFQYTRAAGLLPAFRYGTIIPGHTSVGRS
jgi:hypothetical protein